MFPVRYVGYCAVVLGDYFINHEISGSQDPDSMESKWPQVFGEPWLTWRMGTFTDSTWESCPGFVSHLKLESNLLRERNPTIFPKHLLASSLKLTASSHLKIGHPTPQKDTRKYSNRPFSGVNSLLLSGRVNGMTTDMFRNPTIVRTFENFSRPFF